jgi:hypothetical protein
MSHRAGDYLRSLLPDIEPAEPDVFVETRTHDDDGSAPPPDPPVRPTVERPGPDGRDVRPAPESMAVAADQQLRIRQVEADFLPRVAALLDTPRAVKKAVNLYLLLRATIPDPELDDYLGDERGGPFQAAALLIAGVVSCPAEASDLLDRVMRAEPEEPIGPVLRNEATPVCVRLAGAVDDLGAEFPILGQVSAYQRWARTVARYSFESYALFGVESA